MPSPSLLLGSSTTLVSLLTLLSTPVLGEIYYKLDTDISGNNFFDESNWNYFTGNDPTHGYVDYLSYSAAKSAGLIQGGSSAYIGVDYTNRITDPNQRGRPSVRIESKKSWTKGLFVAKIDHMPGGICGTWPAFWTLSSKDWPSGGEIDIIEGANINQGRNLAALHTLAQCSITGDARLMSGNLQSTDCKYYPGNDGPQGNTNAVGCGIADDDTTTFGNRNQFRPQIFAMEWTSDAIKIWSFPQGQAPSDIDTEPDPSKWGLPSQTFSGPNCNIDAAFSDHRMIFDNTFCGDWAGGWSWDNEGCAASTNYGPGRCAAYVAENPGAFQDSFWSVGYVRVFQKAVRPTTTSVTTTTTSTASMTTITSSMSSSTTTSTTTPDSATINPTIGTTTETTTSGSPIINPTIGTTTTSPDYRPTMGTPTVGGVTSTTTTASWDINPTSAGPADYNTWLAWTSTASAASPVLSSVWSDWNLWSAAASSKVTTGFEQPSTWSGWSTWSPVTEKPNQATSWSEWIAQPAPSKLTQAVPCNEIFGAPAGGCPDCNYEADKKNGFDNGGIIPGPKKENYNNGAYTKANYDNGAYNNGAGPKATSPAEAYGNGNGYSNGNKNGNGNAAVPSATASASWAAWTTGPTEAKPAASTAWSPWTAGSSDTKTTTSATSAMSASWGAWAGNANGTYSGPIAKYTGAAASTGMSIMAVLMGALAFML